MLIEAKKYLYIYVVRRDFGFAPNPFHGVCTLATCKPDIRRSAQVGDWVMGVGGVQLKAMGKCLYLMKVTEMSTFDDYWIDSRFRFKRPLRNGSSVMMVGDNIYHRNGSTGSWMQEDSHHSNADGSPNMTNLKTDTRSANVLISTHFYYFGSYAPLIDLKSIGYRNVRNYRKLSLNDDAVKTFIEKMEIDYRKDRNLVIADPFDFARAAERVDQATGKLT
jgi:hypothetical protein